MPKFIAACRLKDESELLKSSTGGVFTAVSNYFLDAGDAVVSAVYNYDTDLPEFRLYTNKKVRNEARGSKYVQAKALDVFIEAKDYLEEHPHGRLLFVGLGCQADGFRRFVETSRLRERVFIVDLICHGVPSPRIWKDYLANKKPYDFVCFKDKRNGWKHPTAFVRSDDKEMLIADYVKLYYGSCALRPSCYQCHYSKVSRASDITIGDFWGIENVMPDFYSPMGNAAIIVHTTRGLELWNAINRQFDWKESNEDDVLQPNLVSPTRLPRARALFWRQYNKYGIDSALNPRPLFRLLRKVDRKLPPASRTLGRHGGSRDKGSIDAPYTSKGECCGCSACKAICPTRAIRMVTDTEGFEYPWIDLSKCVHCNRCRNVCPLHVENH